MNVKRIPALKSWWSRSARGLGVVLVATMVAAPLAYARGGHHGMGDACGAGPFAAGPMGGDVDPERQSRRLDMMVQHMLGRVDASAAQRTQISTIVKAASADLATEREQMRTQRTKLMELLAAPNIDRAAIEHVRAQQASTHQAISQRMTQAMADAAEVLTPAQRAAWLEAHKARLASRGGVR